MTIAEGPWPNSINLFGLVMGGKIRNGGPKAETLSDPRMKTITAVKVR